MRNSPWAMLITPIWPNVSERPSAASRSSAPCALPFSSGGINASTCSRSLCGGDVRGIRGTRGCLTQPRVRVELLAGGLHELVADARREPVVALEERVGLDERVGGPDDVELVAGVDLADVTRLRDVVVLAVERDGALRRGERDAALLRRGVHRVEI